MPLLKHSNIVETVQLNISKKAAHQQRSVCAETAGRPSPCKQSGYTPSPGPCSTPEGTSQTRQTAMQIKHIIFFTKSIRGLK